MKTRITWLFHYDHGEYPSEERSEDGEYGSWGDVLGRVVEIESGCGNVLKIEVLES
jgi:hypothetical protein